MELKDLGAKLDSLADLMTKLVAEKDTAKAAEAQAKADEAAVKSAVDAYEEAIEAIDAADLFESQVKELRQAAKAGQDVAPLIESAKAVKEEALKAAEVKASDEPQGVLLGGRKLESATELGKVFG